MKKTVRNEEEKKNLIHRLNRISGQVEGVRKMVLDDRYCDDILEVNAVNSCDNYCCFIEIIS